MKDKEKITAAGKRIEGASGETTPPPLSKKWGTVVLFALHHQKKRRGRETRKIGSSWRQFGTLSNGERELCMQGGLRGEFVLGGRITLWVLAKRNT